MTSLMPPFFYVATIVVFCMIVVLFIMGIFRRDDSERIRLTKTIYENGDYSITTDKDHNPFSKIKEEFYQDVFIDEDLWRKEAEQ